MSKKVMCVVMVVLLSIALMGCSANAEEEVRIKVLSAEELEVFNGDTFFNGEYLNIRNQFLSSIYDEPESIDLFGLFYVGSGLEETITDEELLSAMKAFGISGTINQLPSPCEKNSLSNMDAILMEHMDITVEESCKIGLDNMIYLDDYEAYYYFHGDTNYRSLITFNRGEREGNQIRLYYDDVFFGDGAKVLTLMEIDGEYKFKSNQFVKGN